MQFLIYFAVVGSVLLSVLFFASSTQKRPAEDRFFAELKRQTETSRPHSTQRHATKPAPAPEMTETAPEMATATPNVAAAAPDVAAAAPDVAAAAPDVAAAAPETTAAAPDVAAAPSAVATAAPNVAATAPDVAAATPDVAAAPSDVAATAPDTTSAPVVAGQPTTHLVPKVVTNARAEAAPKNKRVAPASTREIPFGGSGGFLTCDRHKKPDQAT